MYIQGSANPRTPGSVNMRIKSCVLLPSAGRKTQLFILIFMEPGICGLADPCRLRDGWTDQAEIWWDGRGHAGERPLKGIFGTPSRHLE